MAATEENLSRPSLETFRLCVQSVCPMFNVSSLKESQFQALYSFICGEEVFVNLPTGSGKSLIFQMAPLVHMRMHENVSAIHWKKNPVIIIISPLLALMQDQVKKLSSLGFKAAFVGPEQDPKILQDIERGTFTFVYLSPESALTTERWRNTLESEIYQESLIGVAVDEVHCVTEWGTSSNNKNRSAFRVWYSRLNEIKSLVDVPFIALTATATQKTKDKIFDLLELRNPNQIVESPNKRNVRYTVQKLDKSLPIVENFRCLVNELKSKGKGTTRSIIYCQTVKQCAHLFRMFELELGLSMYDGEVNPQNRLVQMMHSGSPESVKSHVLEQFADSGKCLRILIATIAYGMGVNCKGVQRVIHFGPSKSIDAYLQESGRCGRDGKQSDAILLYNGINAKASDAEMKKYLESSTCRRQSLLKYFGIRNLECPPGHLCCDICTNSCQCLGGYCDMDLYLPIGNTEEAQGRTISHEQLLSLKRELNALRKTIVREGIAATGQQNALKLACHTKPFEFGTHQVQQAIDNAESIFSISSVLKHVDVWQRRHAVSILKIFQLIFNDVEVPISSSDSDDFSVDQSTDEWMEICNDQSFMELLDMSEWDIDSTMFEEPSVLNDQQPAYPEFLDSVI